MAKTKQQKDEMVAEIVDAIGKSKAVVFANFQGLSIKDTDELRKKAREANIGVAVTKKTLLKIACEQAGITDAAPRELDGGVATLFGFADEVAPAKLVHTFAKTHEPAKILGGILEGHFINAARAQALALLPGKQELLAKMVGSLNAPVSGFVNVLAGNLRGLVRVLDGIRASK